MRHQVNWVANKRVLHVDYNGDVFDDDLEMINQYLEDQLRSSNQVIHLVFDHRHLGKVNTTLERVTNALPALNHPDVGVIFVAGRSTMSKLLGNFFASAFLKNVRMFDDMDSAFNALAEEDRSLPRM